MGFRISWIGFDGKGKSSALEMVGLKDTKEPEVNEAPFSGADIPGGWFILFSNDFQFVSRERLAQLSLDCRIIGRQVHEGILFSAAYGCERGKHVWELRYHAQQMSIDDLSVFGSPPASFESIRQRLTEDRRQAAGDIFDIPVAVAATICKYRYGQFQFEWGRAQFTRLEFR
jgi:hypothetical protein